jgi:hypothetical protein
MNKKMLHMGIMVIMLLFISVGTVSAQTLVANLGDVRIYRYGSGYWGVESDRVQQCLPLKFSRSNTSGWVEIACSSEVVSFASGQIGDYVGGVVKKAFAPYLSPAGSYIAGEIASKVASWAASKGIDYLCN